MTQSTFLQRPFILIMLSFSISYAPAQTFIGITGDLGNLVSFNPDPGDDLLKNPMALSGSVAFIKLEEIRNQWFVQYGGAAGVLGWRMDISDNSDTLSVSTDESFTFLPNYNTIYINGHLDFGKRFPVGNKFVSILLGGGVTYYWDSQVKSGGTVAYGNSWVDIYEYEMHRIDDKVKGFMEASVQTDINRWLLIGLRYRHHFNPCLEGTYNFYHMKDPPSGTLSLTQRALSILFLIKIKN